MSAQNLVKHMDESYLQRLPELVPRDFLIVALTDHFFDDDYIQDFQLPAHWGVPAKCRFTDEKSLIDDADALWFHGPSIRWLPHKKAGQEWIVISMESEQNYPFLSNREIMSMFDLVMTYKLDSDIPCLYPNRQSYGNFQGFPSCAKDKKLAHSNDVPNAPLVYIASNPVPRRDTFVSELMKHIKVDSLGSCLNNCSISGFGDRRGAWFTDVGRVLGRYKFYLAFENTLCEDYVTERVLMALSFGCVPVYQGAPNIEDFLPGEQCLIKVDDFSSPAHLAEYLNYLDQNDAAYDEYLSWRSSGLSLSFQQILDIGSIEPKHRMLIKLLHDCDSNCNCGGRIRF